MENLTVQQQDLRCVPVHFDLASRYLYFTTCSNDNISALYCCQLATGQTELLEKYEGLHCSTPFSHNEKYRIVLKSKGARLSIEVYESRTGGRLTLPRFPYGNIRSVAISRTERLMAFYVNGDRSPNDLYVYEFATEKLRKLTNNLNSEIDPADLVESEEITFRSFDGLDIACLL